MPSGRPTGGALRLPMQRVTALPLSGTASSYSKLLGITSATIRNWCLIGGLPYIQQGNVRIISRDALIKWLVTNQRFEQGQETKT